MVCSARPPLPSPLPQTVAGERLTEWFAAVGDHPGERGPEGASQYVWAVSGVTRAKFGNAFHSVTIPANRFWPPLPRNDSIILGERVGERGPKQA